MLEIDIQIKVRTGKLSIIDALSLLTKHRLYKRTNEDLIEYQGNNFRVVTEISACITYTITDV